MTTIIILHHYDRQLTPFFLQIWISNEFFWMSLSAVRRRTAGALSLFAQTSRSRILGHFFQLRLENQNDQKYDNFDKALFTNNGNIIYWMCIWSEVLSVESDHINYHKRPNYHNLLCLQASCFDALRYVILLCAVPLGTVFMCCGSKYQVMKYLFIILY